MKVYNILTIFALVFVLCIIQVSAYDNIGTYRQDIPINLNLGCSYSNTYCNNSFVCNLTVYAPNSTILLNNVVMSNVSFPQYNYSLTASQLSTSGLYYGREVCCSGLLCDDYSFSFNVNPQGVEYNSTQGMIYIILVFLLILIFGYSIYNFSTIEYSNTRGDSGNIVSVNYRKYLKIGSGLLAYLMFICITYIAWNISYGILRFTEMADIFKFLFRLSFIGLFPLFVGIIILSVVQFMQDRKYEEYIQRGLTIK